MASGIDRRQARTRQLLRKALMELIEEKGIDGVTVTDIANRADINRGTFYLHYQDVPDMLEQLKNEVFEQIRKITALMDIAEVIDHANRGVPYPVAVRIFEELTRHADFLRAMLGPRGDLSFALRYRQFMSSQIFHKINYIQPRDEQLLIPRDYLVAYVSSANFGIVMHWLETGMSRTPEEMGAMMTSLVARGPFLSAGLIK